MTTEIPVKQQAAYDEIVAQLDAIGAEYKDFTHRPIRNYEDAELARQESGFEGTESKSMVLKTGDTFFVYVTLAGRRTDFKAIRAHVGGPKPKLATDDELREHFGAEPGSAFPFGFDASVAIYVDPEVFVQEWLLIGPAIPTKTIQMHGEDLRKIYDAIGNPVEEVTTFNQAPAVES